MTDIGTVLPTLKKEMGNIDFAILAEFVEQKQIAKGGVAVSADDLMDEAFFILSGRFSIELSGEPPHTRELNHAGPGKWIGQMFFLEPGESTVTLSALDDCTIGCLGREGFEKMSTLYPAAAGKLLRLLSLELSNNLRSAGKLLFRRFAWDQVEGSEGNESAKQWFTKVFCELNSFSA